MAKSFTGQSAILKNVPKNERIYDLLEEQQDDDKDDDNGKVDSGEEVCSNSKGLASVAIHRYGGGRSITSTSSSDVGGAGYIMYMGDVQYNILDHFLYYYSPKYCVDVFAKIDGEDGDDGGENDVIEKIQTLKQSGNEAFGKKQYLQAIEQYQDAIRLYNGKAGSYNPSSLSSSSTSEQHSQSQQYVLVTLYSNMSECFIRLKHYEDAIQASKQGLFYTKYWVFDDDKCDNNDIQRQRNEHSKEQLTLIVKLVLRLGKARLALVKGMQQQQQQQKDEESKKIEKQKTKEKKENDMASAIIIIESAYDDMFAFQTKYSYLLETAIATDEQRTSISTMMKQIQQMKKVLTKKQRDYFRKGFTTGGLYGDKKNKHQLFLEGKYTGEEGVDEIEEDITGWLSEKKD